MNTSLHMIEQGNTFSWDAGQHSGYSYSGIGSNLRTLTQYHSGRVLMAEHSYTKSQGVPPAGGGGGGGDCTEFVRRFPEAF